MNQVIRESCVMDINIPEGVFTSAS